MPRSRTRYRKQRVKLLKKSSKKTRRKRLMRGGNGDSLLPLPSTPAPTKRPIQDVLYAPTKYGVPPTDFDRENIDIRFPQQLNHSIMNMQDNNIVFDSEKIVKGLGHKDFMDSIFDNVSEKFRKKMESLSASQQCIKTIGACENCNCWLCGEKISQGQKAECEHILPVARSILFTGIKPTKKIETRRISFGDNPEMEKMEQYYKLSYDYAHKGCNLKKSDTVLIKWDKSNQKIVYDEETGRELATSIKTIVETKKTIKDLCSVYEEKINKLIQPVNEEIHNILNRPYGSMDLYWAYTFEIMKTYVDYEYLVKNEFLQGPKLKRAKTIMENDSYERLIPENISTENSISTEDSISTEEKILKSAEHSLEDYREQHLKALRSLRENLDKTQLKHIPIETILPPPPPPK